MPTRLVPRAAMSTTLLRRHGSPRSDKHRLSLAKRAHHVWLVPPDNKLARLARCLWKAKRLCNGTEQASLYKAVSAIKTSSVCSEAGGYDENQTDAALGTAAP